MTFGVFRSTQISEVCHYKPRAPLQLYQEKFEQKFLNETSMFYDQQARKFLESGDVGNYMSQVLRVLQDEECRAFEFLDRSTMSKQKQRIEKVRLQLKVTYFTQRY